MLKYSHNTKGAPLYDEEKREIPIDGSKIYFILRPLDTTEIAAQLKGKCICYPLYKYDEVVERLESMNILYQIKEVFVEASFQVTIEDDTITFPINAVKKSDNVTDWLMSGGDIDAWTYNRQLDYDTQIKVVDFDIPTRTGTVQFYIPAIAFT